jgi:uncharacterized protein
MIHPDTTVKIVSKAIGNGVFATAFIPKGSIIVVRDPFDITLSLRQFRELQPAMQRAMETYMYHDKSGQLVLSWDHARYMNHSCDSNTMMTDYSLEIVIRDIFPGDEITTDYGLLNVQEPYELFCRCKNCRGALRTDDIDRYATRWDQQILESLLLINTVPQPLLPILADSEQQRLAGLHRETETYSSVKSLKYQYDRQR